MKEKRNIVVLGSTGSIGTQTLDVIWENQEEFQVFALVGNSNVKLLSKQALKFKPKYLLVSENKYKEQLESLLNDSNFIIGLTDNFLEEAISDPCVQMVISAISGFNGVYGSYLSIKHGKDLGLANKETMVTGGDFIVELAKEKNVKIIPVDSEHSAIYQCLSGDYRKVEKIILTASGGAFRDYSLEELKNVSVKDALNHPNWSMGKKITVDSATLVNKGLEVMEAHYLFAVDYDQIEVVIHKESIVHSMVQFEDSSVIAQLGLPTMKLPIFYALNHGQSRKSNFERLDLSKIGQLNFEKPREIFRSLDLAYQAGREKKGAPIIFNSASEIAVEKFLREEIKFLDISYLIEKALDGVGRFSINTIDDIIEVDKITREYLRKK